MAQKTITVKQVLGDEQFECPLQIDTLGDADISFVIELFMSYLRYFNQRAMADENVSDRAAENLRLYSPRPTTGGSQVLRIADRIRFLEQAIQEDAVIKEESDLLVDRCLPRASGAVREEEGEGEGTDSGRPQQAGSGAVVSSSQPDFTVAYGFVKEVFQQLFSREETSRSKHTTVPYLHPVYYILTNTHTHTHTASASTLALRFMLLLEFCYQFCKKLIVRTLNTVTAQVAVGFVCTIAGYFARYLWEKHFYDQIQRLGGWVRSTVCSYEIGYTCIIWKCQLRNTWYYEL